MEKVIRWAKAPVADNREVKKNIKRLERVKTWQLLILLILMGFVTATFLRLNNIGMLQRREAVLQADTAGDSGAVTSGLVSLQRFSSEHMNASTGPFYLETLYSRDVERAVNGASNLNNPNGNVYAKADSVCKPQFSSYSPAYLACFQAQLDKYPEAKQASALRLPDPALYRQEFMAPFWSPDFAGWSLVACAVIVLLIVVRLTTLGILHLLLRRHYQSV